MNSDKIDKVTLALLQLVMRDERDGEGAVASLQFDRSTLERLRQKGLIDAIDDESVTARLTADGAQQSRALFEQLFMSPDADVAAEVETVDETKAAPADGHRDVYLSDPLLDNELRVDRDDLRPISLDEEQRAALFDQFSSRRGERRVGLDTRASRVIRWASDEDASDSVLEVEGLSGDDIRHDKSDFASLVRHGDLAAWIHDVIEETTSLDEWRRELQRVEGLWAAWRAFERDRARHRLRHWLARHGYELAQRE